MGAGGTIIFWKQEMVGLLLLHEIKNISTTVMFQSLGDHSSWN